MEMAGEMGDGEVHGDVGLDRNGAGDGDVEGDRDVGR